MSKKKKQRIRMVDMSARLNIEIISTTDDNESQILENDLKEIEISVEKRMQLYETEIREMFLSIANESVIETPKHGSSYFIEKYEDMIDRNSNNIIRRMQLLKGYLLKIDSDSE